MSTHLRWHERTTSVSILMPITAKCLTEFAEPTARGGTPSAPYLEMVASRCVSLDRRQSVADRQMGELSRLVGDEPWSRAAGQRRVSTWQPISRPPNRS